MYLSAQIQLVTLLLIKLQCHFSLSFPSWTSYSRCLQVRIYLLSPTLISLYNPLPICLGPGFCKLLQQCTNRQKQHTTNLEDICDGNQYQLLLQNGLLGRVHSISFTLNTDGVAVFHSQSSKYSFWPIYLMINELPIKERYTSIAEN